MKLTFTVEINDLERSFGWDETESICKCLERRLKLGEPSGDTALSELIVSAQCTGVVWGWFS